MFDDRTDLCTRTADGALPVCGDIAYEVTGHLGRPSFVLLRALHAHLRLASDGVGRMPEGGADLDRSQSRTDLVCDLAEPAPRLLPALRDPPRLRGRRLGK